MIYSFLNFLKTTNNQWIFVIIINKKNSEALTIGKTMVFANLIVA